MSLTSHQGPFGNGLGQLSIKKVILKVEEGDQEGGRDKTQGTFAITRLKEMLMWLECQALGGNQVDFSGSRALMKNWNKGTKKICDGVLPIVLLHFQFSTSKWTSYAYPFLACQLCIAIPFLDCYSHHICNEPQDSCVFGTNRTLITPKLFGMGKKEPSTTHNMNWASFSGHIQILRPCVSILTCYISGAHTLFKPDHTSIGIISIPPQILGHYILNI